MLLVATAISWKQLLPTVFRYPTQIPQQPRMSQTLDLPWPSTLFESFSPSSEIPFNTLFEAPSIQPPGVAHVPRTLEPMTESSEHNTAILPPPDQTLSSPMGPPVTKRAKKASTLNAEAWSLQKDRVLQLHIAEGRPLKEVREIMERDFGFVAT